jgi:hypothetical protein
VSHAKRAAPCQQALSSDSRIVTRMATLSLSVEFRNRGVNCVFEIGGVAEGALRLREVTVTEVTETQVTVTDNDYGDSALNRRTRCGRSCEA